MNIAEFRQNHPEYGDMNDVALTRALHKKFYSDMPFEAFATKFNPARQRTVAVDRTPKDAKGITSVPFAPLEKALERDSAERHLMNQWLRDKIKTGEIEQVKPSFWQQLWSKAPQIAGATAGGIVGAATVGPDPTDMITVPAAAKAAAKFTAAVTGAGMGAATGKGFQESYRMTRPGAKPKSLKQIYKEMSLAAAEEAAAEAGGRVISGIGGKLLRPVKKRLLPAAGRVNKILQKYGVFLTPAQATESRIIDTVEGMAEKSFLGGGKLQRLKTLQQPRALSQYIDDVVKTIAKGTRKELTPEDAGNLLLDTIRGKKQVFRATARAAYGKVDRLTKGATVSLVPLKKRARQFAVMAAKRKGVGATQAGDTLLQKIMKLDDVVDFKGAQSLRSGLLDEISAMSLSKDKAMGMAREFVGLTDGAMETAAKELSPEAQRAWRIANKFYRYGGARREIGIIPGMTDFDSKIVKSLLKNLDDNPEIVVKKIFTPGASKQIRLIKKFADKEGWARLKAAHLKNLLIVTADPDTIVSGKTFLKTLNRMGDKTLREIYSPEELRSIRLIGETASFISKPTGGSGGMLIQLMQAGAVVNMGRMAVGGQKFAAEESVAVVIGPPLLSRLLSNRTGAKWLSEGLQVPRLLGGKHLQKAPPVVIRILREAHNAQKRKGPQTQEYTTYSEPLPHRL